MDICRCNKKHQNKECVFCGNAVEVISGICVCKNCNIVCFSGRTSQDEMYRLILEYLTNTESKVLKRQNYLHDLEQKYISRESLTPNEKEILEKFSEFQDIRFELKPRVENGAKLCGIEERKLLYRLLILSKWLSEYLGKDDNCV